MPLAVSRPSVSVPVATNRMFDARCRIHGYSFASSIPRPPAADRFPAAAGLADVEFSVIVLRKTQGAPRVAGLIQL
jgi:hypothetical protein